MIDFICGVEVRRINRWIQSDECQAGIGLFYLFYCGIIAINKDNGDLSAVYVALFMYDDNIAILDTWFH